MSERRVRRGEQVIERRRLPGSVVFLIVVGTLVAGYVLGTYHEQLYVRIVAPLIGVKVADSSTLDLSLIRATYAALKANYDGELSDEVLLEGAARGLVAAAGDDYTLYMNADERAKFEAELEGSIGGGIGAEIGLRSDRPTIVRVLKNNPAEAAGLNAGDVIVSVNDQAVADQTVEQIVLQIRGQVATTVKLVVLRDGVEKTFTITRAEVTNPSVESRIDGLIGIVTISRFDNETGSLVRAAAKELKALNVKGIILDLRGNGGGYVSAAQEVAGLWLDKQVVVTEKTNNQVVDELQTGSDPLLGGVPTVVLVNGSSASASEIVAGALQEYGVAKLVGEKTFGKGSVQKLIELPAGAELKVTVARWFTPQGKNITKDGIVPDKTIELTQADVNAGRDPQLDGAKALLNL